MDTTNQTGQQGSRDWTIASWCKKIVNTCEEKLHKCHKFGKFLGYTVATVATPVLLIPAFAFDLAYAAKDLYNRKVAKHQPGSNQIPASSQNPNEQNTQQQGAKRQVAATGGAPTTPQQKAEQQTTRAKKHVTFDTRTPDQLRAAINKLEMEKQALKGNLEKLVHRKQDLEQCNNNLQYHLEDERDVANQFETRVRELEQEKARQHQAVAELEAALQSARQEAGNQQHQTVAELEEALASAKREAGNLMQRVETNAQRIDQLEGLSAAKDQELAAMRNELGTNVDALQKVQKYNIEQAQRFEKERARDKELVKQYEQQNESLVAQLQLQGNLQERYNELQKGIRIQQKQVDEEIRLRNVQANKIKEYEAQIERLKRRLGELQGTSFSSSARSTSAQSLMRLVRRSEPMMTFARRKESSLGAAGTQFLMNDDDDSLLFGAGKEQQIPIYSRAPLVPTQGLRFGTPFLKIPNVDTDVDSDGTNSLESESGIEENTQL